jgi:hypothetical protein
MRMRCVCSQAVAPTRTARMGIYAIRHGPACEHGSAVARLLLVLREVDDAVGDDAVGEAVRRLCLATPFIGLPITSPTGWDVSQRVRALRSFAHGAVHVTCAYAAAEGGRGRRTEVGEGVQAGALSLPSGIARSSSRAHAPVHAQATRARAVTEPRRAPL